MASSKSKSNKASIKKRQIGKSSVQKQRKPRRWLRFLGKLCAAGFVIAACFLIYLDANIRLKFEGKRWAVPAKVYARPLELYTGANVSKNQIIDELTTLGYHANSQLNHSGTYYQSENQLFIHTRDFQFWDGHEKAKIIKVTIENNRVTALTDKNDKVLGLIRLDPMIIGGIYPAHNEDRELVKIEQVPQLFIDILVAVEDRSYYQHFGVSIRGLARAMYANIKAGAFVQGGSTLTQQLVKNFYLNSDRTLTRKLIEMPMAVLLDWHYDKDEILETYINEVYLGQIGRRSIHGFGTASRHYFAKPISELEVHQVALLVALLKGPSVYNPRKNPQNALRRRNVVIDILAEQEIITIQQAAEYKEKSLDVTPEAALSALRFPAYMDLVRRQLRRDYRSEDLSSEGLRIFTNFDPWAQKQAEQSVAKTLKEIEGRLGERAKGLECAVVVTNRDTGEVLAVVGGKDVRYSGFNRALDAVRPIGSLIKPAVYLTALQDSGQYSLVTKLDDSEIYIQQPNGKSWQPKNYDKEYHGFVPLHRSLAKSYNVATVRLGLTLGLDKVINTLQKLGVEREMQEYPSLLLGTLHLSPIEVTTYYQTIAAGGFRTPLRAIREVSNQEGEPLARYPLSVEQVIDPGAVHLLQYAMQETMREGTGRSAYRTLSKHLNLAGKTGTTNDLKDSWFAGFTGDRLAVVWVGKDDNTPTPLTGSSGALQVWAKLMLAIQSREAFMTTLPDNVHYAWIDEQTGALTEPNCPNARYVPFLDENLPDQYVNCVQSVDSQSSEEQWYNNWFQ